jgi:hypothetical protein
VDNTASSINAFSFAEDRLEGFLLSFAPSRAMSAARVESDAEAPLRVCRCVSMAVHRLERIEDTETLTAPVIEL